MLTTLLFIVITIIPKQYNIPDNPINKQHYIESNKTICYS
jgi:hypothetical protein